MRMPRDYKEENGDVWEKGSITYAEHIYAQIAGQVILV